MRRLALALTGLVLAASARAETLGSDVYAIGPGDLPWPGSILSLSQVAADMDLCVCVGGWAQNWHDPKTDHLSQKPAIALFDEGASAPAGRGHAGHVQLCPAVEVGKTAAGERTLFPASFAMKPLVPTVQAGHWIGVEVTIRGEGYIRGGGELWDKAIAAAPGECP